MHAPDQNGRYGAKLARHGAEARCRGRGRLHPNGRVSATGIRDPPAPGSAQRDSLRRGHRRRWLPRATVCSNAPSRRCWTRRLTMRAGATPSGQWTCCAVSTAAQFTALAANARGNPEATFAACYINGDPHHEIVADWAENYSKFSENVPRIGRLPIWQLTHNEELFTAAEKRTSPMYNEFQPEVRLPGSGGSGRRQGLERPNCRRLPDVDDGER